MRQEIAHRVHDANSGFPVFDAHVNVKAKDEVRARNQLQILDHAVIAFIRVDLLRTPIGEWMRGSGDQAKAMLVGKTNHVAAQIEEIFLGVADILADAGSDFDDGLMHLGLDALFEAHLALFEQLSCDVRTQVARFAVNRLVLLFDSEGECRLHRWSLRKSFKAQWRFTLPIFLPGRLWAKL